MRSHAKTRTAGPLVPILASLCFAAATSAHAASNGQVINEQIQLGDVFSSQTLNVEEAPEGLSAATTAVGNIVSGVGQATRLDFRSSQSVDQHVEGATDATVNGATGQFFQTSTSATGNSATAGTCCALTLGSSIQEINAGAVIAADAISRTGDTATSISVDSSAVGNTTGWNQVNGEIQAWSYQANDGLTSATNVGDFAGSPGNIGLSATSVGNNVTVDSKNAALDIGVEQSRRGPGVTAVVDTVIGSGVDVQSVATASGNLVDAQFSSPNAAMNISQTASAGLDAYSDLQLTEWSGDANSVAYGVGNSILVSNVGPATQIYSEQNSGGDVSATAAFTGGAGKAVFASSTAIGNAVSGYACTECGGDFAGYNRQVNSSRVGSQSNVLVTGRGGLVSGESTAIGNTATYQVFSNGGQ